MIALSDSAKKRFDNYLKEVRASLRDSVTIDTDEVERNIVEHVENELAAAEEPVSLSDLNIVLEKLGSPRKWIPEEELPWWRKTILRLHTGPEDWRLAYIAFVIMVLASLVFVCNWVKMAVVLVAASFIFSRATLSMVGDQRELKAQRWLIYPSLIVVYVPLLCLLLLWPLLLICSSAFGLRHNQILYDQSLGFYPAGARYAGTTGILILLGTMGLWWSVVGIIGCVGPGLFKAVFRPFADNFKRKWAVLLLLLGILLVLFYSVAWFLSMGQGSHFTRS